MRVAVSFSGLPRVVTPALECWARLIAQHSADVYMHAWDTDASAIPVLLQALNPAAVIIEKPREFTELDRYKIRAQSSDPYGVFSMWTSINESMLLMRRRGQRYDRVIRARTDVIFDDFEFLDVHGVVVPGKPAEVYCWNGMRYPGWHDLMAYGDHDSMMEYASTLHEIPRIYEEGSPFFSEFFLSTNLFRRRVNTTHHGIFADIIRA